MSHLSTPRFTREARVQRRKRKRERIFDWLDAYKRRKGCAKCGSKGAGRRLELDHIIPRYLSGRPRKPLLKGKTSWMQALYYRFHPNVQVLCHTCHLVKTRQESFSEATTSAKAKYLPNMSED